MHQSLVILLHVILDCLAHPHWALEELKVSHASVKHSAAAIPHRGERCKHINHGNRPAYRTTPVEKHAGAELIVHKCIHHQ